MRLGRIFVQQVWYLPPVINFARLQASMNNVTPNGTGEPWIWTMLWIDRRSTITAMFTHDKYYNNSDIRNNINNNNNDDKQHQSRTAPNTILIELLCFQLYNYWRKHSSMVFHALIHDLCSVHPIFNSCLTAFKYILNWINQQKPIDISTHTCVHAKSVCCYRSKPHKWWMKYSNIQIDSIVPLC